MFTVNNAWENYELYLFPSWREWKKLELEETAILFHKNRDIGKEGYVEIRFALGSYLKQQKKKDNSYSL